VREQFKSKNQIVHSQSTHDAGITPFERVYTGGRRAAFFWF